MAPKPSEAQVDKVLFDDVERKAKERAKAVINADIELENRRFKD